MKINKTNHSAWEAFKILRDVFFELLVKEDASLQQKTQYDRLFDIIKEIVNPPPCPDCGFTSIAAKRLLECSECRCRYSAERATQKHKNITDELDDIDRQVTDLVAKKDKLIKIRNLYRSWKGDL